uniref:Putative septum formation initiator n=1 Tax=viral metagenome TaxID=1070528 RepID=A0A6H2A077_9ZZZZ
MNDEILVPLDLSDAIAMIDRQKEQIAALTTENERLRKEIKEIKEKIKLTNEYVDKYHGLAGGRSLEDSIKVEREIALNQSETQWLNR